MCDGEGGKGWGGQEASEDGEAERDLFVGLTAGGGRLPDALRHCVGLCLQRVGAWRAVVLESMYRCSSCCARGGKGDGRRVRE